jgi:hypothetical protein
VPGRHGNVSQCLQAFNKYLVSRNVIDPHVLPPLGFYSAPRPADRGRAPTSTAIPIDKSKSLTSHSRVKLQLAAQSRTLLTTASQTAASQRREASVAVKGRAVADHVADFRMCAAALIPIDTH